MATKPKELTQDEQKAVDYASGKPTTLEQGDPEVQATVDAETEQGFRGVKVDPLPNEAYTLTGVTKNK